ncbi:hypothetical protein J4E85_005017 [Alternaria conjuncta]|uniref:uncharacterized protein n=1 Tax=Alternaria conjuncta TaxID=181017 RepID=UPI002220167A|nr:uncharacterized protein J4E85_005017 [Alternaria conjuncta]KAI4930390.1 hypothetical protein J4E85_005017 [Alternaria conjuncta]
MADTQEFRFLDLPKDIRLEIYDLFPAETRRYTVRTLREPSITPFTLVLERIPCMALLTTCRQIFDEVSAMLGSRVDGQPLRIFADAEDLCDNVISVIACYALPNLRCESLKTRIERYSPSRQNGPEDQDVPEVPHQALRHNITAAGSKLEIEIALELDGDLRQPSLNLQRTRGYLRIFYKWIVSRGASYFFRDDHINITIRPKPTAGMSEKSISDGRVFDFEEYPKEFWLGRMWTCQVGECITESEWQRNWEEGKRFGRLKRM